MYVYTGMTIDVCLTGHGGLLLASVISSGVLPIGG